MSIPAAPTGEAAGDRWSQAWRAWFLNAGNVTEAVYSSGTTANRPTKPLWVGRPYFNTSLVYPEFYNGTAWQAAMGVATQGSLLYGLTGGAWAQLTKGSALQQLRMNAGATAPEWATISNAATLATEQASTSGTNIDFTSGIVTSPSEVVVHFKGVSTNSTSALLVQIGDATTGGFVSSGYDSASGNRSGEIGSTAGFLATQSVAAANAFTGKLVLSLENPTSFDWIATGCVQNEGTNIVHFSAGRGTLAGVLDRVRITTVSGDTFDAGAVNLLSRQ